MPNKEFNDFLKKLEFLFFRNAWLHIENFKAVGLSHFAAVRRVANIILEIKEDKRLM